VSKTKFPEPTLSNDNLNNINVILSHDIIAAYMRKHSKMRFQVGDILVKRFDNGQLETVSNINPQVKRWMYVYEDPETGIGFIKQIKVDLTLSDSVLSIAQLHLHGEAIFEIDPELIESTILGDGTVDIASIQNTARQHKQEIISYNKMLWHCIDSFKDANSVVSTMKIDDHFFIATGNTRNQKHLGTNISEYKVISIDHISVSNLDYDDKRIMDNICKVYNKKSSKGIYKLIIKQIIHNGQYQMPQKTIYSFHLINYKGLYLSKPRNIMDRQ